MQRRRISSYISALASKASAAIPTRASLAIPTRYAKVLALSLLLLGGLASPAHAQSKAKKMVEQPDTVPLFRGLAVSVDAIGLGQMVLGSYGQYEAALRINLKDKYFPVLELGYGKADATDDGTNLHYKTSAPYARIGVDWNLLRNKHDIYRLYGGVRYAFTTYKYDVEGPDITDPIWGNHHSLLCQGCILQLSLVGGLLRHRREDMGTYPNGMEREIQATHRPQGR